MAGFFKFIFFAILVVVGIAIPPLGILILLFLIYKAIKG